MISKDKCPNCGQETLEQVWLGINPQRCSNCGDAPKQAEVIC